jgi:hypothetical protein
MRDMDRQMENNGDKVWRGAFAHSHFAIPESSQDQSQGLQRAGCFSYQP